MAENVDDFKENDDMNQQNEILRKNRPFSENFINLSPRDFEYIMGIKDGGVNIDVDLDIDDIDILKDEYCDDGGYIKPKTLKSKLVNQREKELSLVRKDIGHMALELDGLKHVKAST
ncbi:hypothetical protein WN944_014157 [Citrus x changshan-huyou]|uniref:Uncharacterized protein n=1 Tax=Citrus x changshan-huyou TaxID=2935761 RepID=A0AAP0MA33_9ROSI